MLQLSDVNISPGLRAVKTKKYYMLASIQDEPQTDAGWAPRTDMNSVLFPQRYYQETLRWDEKRVLNARSLSGKVLRIEILERHIMDNAIELLNKNAIGAVRNKSAPDPTLRVEDASRANDTLEATVTISLQGLELYGQRGLHGWYPLQVVHSEAVHEKITRPLRQFRKSLTGAATAAGKRLSFSRNEVEMNLADQQGGRAVEYTAISPETFEEMVKDGTSAGIPHMEILIVAQQSAH